MAYDIQGNWYPDPMENENFLSSGSMMTGQGVSTPISQTGYQGFIHPWVKQNFPLAGNWDQPGLMETVNPGYQYDTQGYKAFGIPQASSGVDNKQEYIKSLIDAGAVNLSGNPLSWDNLSYGGYVRVPDANIDKVGKAVDYNPSEDKDWGPLLGAMFLGGVGLSGGFGGLMGEAVGESAASDVLGNTLITQTPYGAALQSAPVGTYGSVAMSTTPELATNALYGGILGGGVGSTVGSLIPDTFGNTLVNQTQYGPALQSVPESATGLLGQSLGTPMSTTPELSQGLLSQAYANGVTPGSTSLWDKLLNGKMPMGGMQSGTPQIQGSSEDNYTPSPIDQGLIEQYGHSVAPGSVQYQQFKQLSPLYQLYQERLNQMRGTK